LLYILYLIKIKYYTLDDEKIKKTPRHDKKIYAKAVKTAELIKTAAFLTKARFVC